MGNDMIFNRSIARLSLFVCLSIIWGGLIETTDTAPVVQNSSPAQSVKKKGERLAKKNKQEEVKKENIEKENIQPVVAIKNRPDLSPAKRRQKRLEEGFDKSKKSKKTLSAMNFQELKKSKEDVLASGNKETAIKYLEKMIPQCTDMRKRESIMIELGDLYYETGHFVNSYTMYREFASLYPGSQQVEYALYRAIVCKYDTMSDAERDQTTTKEAITLAEEFLERGEVFVTYKDKVEEILKKSRERLFENELTIFNFYLSNKRIIAANKRLDSMRKEFISLVPELEPRIILLEVELAQAVNNTEVIDKKQNELITKFPDYETRVAQAKPKKKHFTARF